MGPIALTESLEQRFAQTTVTQLDVAACVPDISAAELKTARAVLKAEIAALQEEIARTIVTLPDGRELCIGDYRALMDLVKISGCKLETIFSAVSKIRNGRVLQLDFERCGLRESDVRVQLSAFNLDRQEIANPNPFVELPLFITRVFGHSRLATLKASPLYEAEQKRSLELLYAHDRFSIHNWRATRLLEILYVAGFDLMSAKEIEKAGWPPATNKSELISCYGMETDLSSTYHDTTNKLLDILIQAQFTHTTAFELYSKFKASGAFDSASGLWLPTLSPPRAERYSVNQLFGLLTQAAFDHEAAEKLLGALKTTALFDPTTGQWNEYIWSNQWQWQRQGTNRLTRDQLLGVLVEAEFDKDFARQMYERLKATSLFDRAANQWRAGMSSDQAVVNENCYLADQLLALLVEAKLQTAWHWPLLPGMPPEQIF
jgi:hypothetical protein